MTTPLHDDEAEMSGLPKDIEVGDVITLERNGRELRLEVVEVIGPGKARCRILSPHAN